MSIPKPAGSFTPSLSSWGTFPPAAAPTVLIKLPMNRFPPSTTLGSTNGALPNTSSNNDEKPGGSLSPSVAFVSEMAWEEVLGDRVPWYGPDVDVDVAGAVDVEGMS